MEGETCSAAPTPAGSDEGDSGELEDEEDNICTPWTLEDDRILYARYRSGVPVEAICAELKRGYNGVQERWKSINNPNHNAFLRLFPRSANRDASTSSTTGDDASKKAKVRPCKVVIQRILWGQEQQLGMMEYFSFTYTDRFDGICQGSFLAPNVNVKGKERLLIKAIPEHRIQTISFKDRVIWDKAQRIDLVFGSAGSDMKLEEAITTYDVWKEEETIKAALLAARQPKVFCDLDGVLADFDAGIVALFGRKPDEVSPRSLWARVASTPNFFSSLPWTDDGRVLWDAIKTFNPTILTGVPNGSEALRQKREWCARELGIEVDVITCLSKDKHIYCEKAGDILIDDREKFRDQWEQAGGLFLHHRSAEETVRRLNSEIATS